MTRFFVGLDLGQANDYTAVAVLQKLEATAGSNGADYHVRHLERVRDMPYPQIVGKVKAMLQSSTLAGSSSLVIDQTGCGRPVFDMFKTAGLSPVGVQIHGGDSVTHEGDTWRVPKRDLVGVLQVLFQSSGRLKISKKLPLASTLQGELLNFKVKIDPRTAHDAYSAWREQDHDDLVLAVALACWWGEHGPPPAPICAPAGAVVASRWAGADGILADRWL